MAMTPGLPDLAARIDAAVRDAEMSARTAVNAALCAGRLLIEAKGLLQYGEWEQWVLSNCSCAPRTAQAYMRLAKRFAELPAEEAQRVAELPLREAMTAIATAPDKPGLVPMYAARATDWHKARPAFQSTARSVASLARDVGVRPIKQGRIKSLREKLLATVAELDRMLMEGKP
jgi:hypothetical protein